MTLLTVIICTHNPREDYIAETLSALRAQTASPAEWDLLIIDNASNPPLVDRLEINWHPNAAIIREEKLGTAHARLRSLREMQTKKSDLILFVDDDNILQPNYISEGLRIGKAWPNIACWGGQLLPRYETEPPSWLNNYKKLLAIFPLNAPMWGNQLSSYDMVPPTAGCFLRRQIWERYLAMVEEMPLRLSLGAKGAEQVRGEDTDLVLTALDLKQGVGRFPELILTHIMPAGRLTAAYLENIIAGANFGISILEFIRYNRVPQLTGKNWWGALRRHWQAARLPKPIGRFYLAEQRGRARADRVIAEWKSKDRSSTPSQ